MVMALGITMTGEKRFLGFLETDTENAQVLTLFLRSLLERVNAEAAAGSCMASSCVRPLKDVTPRTARS